MIIVPNIWVMNFQFSQLCQWAYVKLTYSSSALFKSSGEMRFMIELVSYNANFDIISQMCNPNTYFGHPTLT